MKKSKYTKANFVILLCLVMISAVIGIQISKFNAEPIQGAYNGLVAVFEDEIDAGNLTEEQILDDIRKGYINSECDIGRFIVQGYLTEYKETLIAEGLLTQDGLDWAEEHYGSGQKTGQTNTTPQPTPEPTTTPTSEAPATENTETTEPEQQTEVTQEEPVEEITEEPHVPVWTETENVLPSCTEDGYIRYESDTGEVKTDSLPATGHDYQSEITQYSTCTENGIKTYTCKSCGDSYTEEYPLAAHEWEEDITPASFFKEGLKTTYCKNCGEISESVAIPCICPVPLPLFITIATVLVVAIVAGIVLIIRKKRK